MRTKNKTQEHSNIEAGKRGTSKWNQEQATSEAGRMPNEWGVLGKLGKTVHWEKNDLPHQMELTGEVKQGLRTDH